ncbi:hypothetical protein NUU61_010134 [Penicillium alfredii]|uniref:Cysteine-rich secreted protein n=1 Tax=Penicillium alfredii TaxID=1506179 RepID=A0A9W9JUD3_9EURO|nr:uncharacterized protein NUU61_010134 [Penicillium alfredii]KAJ5081870.1 hypothetical protein NUU61_010134 [Penicillium alfredii]
MKTLGFGLAAFLLHPLLISAKTYTKNVPVKEIQGKWSVDGNTITWVEDGFKTSVDCDNQAGHKKLSMSSNKKFAGCCLEGQNLLGSPETAFDCCAEGHDLTGSAEAGYRCCPSGEVFDGETCKRKEPTCQNGKVLVNGECVCPAGSKETDDGKCKKQKCSSGLETGKCYTFTGENGERLGFGGSWFIAAPESMSLKSGRFQLCKDEECKAGLPINPSDLTYIRDIHGNPGTGAYPNRWLNNAMNGNHIGKTDNFAQAGKFSITKWPCGKYCLGGFDYGLGPACPSATPAITFFQNDPQACVPFDFTEVPCDVKAEENNCIWKNSDDQCCGGKVDCPSLKATS